MKKHFQKLCLFLFISLLFSCIENKPKKEDSVPEFRVLEVREKTIDVTTLFAANLEGLQQVELRP
jgi:membrane fusion protein (multidrug efflux system)